MAYPRQFALFLVAVALGGVAVARGAQLTAADIPTDISPQLQKLLAQTFSADPHQSAAAVRSIGQMQPPPAAAVPFLIRLMGVPDPDRTGIANAPIYFVRDILSQMGEPALDAVITAANDHSNRKKIYAINCLNKFESPRADAALLQLLESQDRDTRHWTVECFMSRRDPKSVEPLLKMLRNATWSERFFYNGPVSSIIEALGNQRDQRAVRTLLDVLRGADYNEWHRQAAAIALGQISERTSCEVLIEMLQDRSVPSFVRAGAALGIGAYRPILSMAGESRELVRDDGRILYLMGNVLNNNQENDEMRIAAARALGDFDNPNAIEILLPVVASYGHAPLGFWSAASIVKLTGGETGDPSVVAAVRNYRRIENELPIIDLVAQIEALEMIAAHGNWRAQLALRGISLTMVAVAICAVGLVCFGVVRLAQRRKRRKSALL